MTSFVLFPLQTMGVREEISYLRCARGGTDQPDQGFRAKRDGIYAT